MWDTAELTEPAVRIHDRLASFGNVLLRPFELPYVSCSSYREEVEHALAEHFSGTGIAGFDIEWKPNKSAHDNNPTALIQVASFDAVVLAPVHHLRDAHNRPAPNRPGFVPERLQQLLSNPAVVKLGIGIHQDLEKLEDDYSVRPQGFVDLAVLAWAYGMGDMGLKSMCAAFGHPLQKSKNISMSNWENVSLSGSQIMYAAQDAWASVWLCLRLFHRFARGDSVPVESAAPIAVAELLRWMRPFVGLANRKALLELAAHSPQLFAQEVHGTIQRWQHEQAERDARRKDTARGKRLVQRNRPSATVPPAASAQTVPDKACANWARGGACTYGDKCKFAHSGDGGGGGGSGGRGGRGGGGNVPLGNTKLCVNILNDGECSYGDRCHFAHR